MIINALSSYYDSLAENGEIAEPGWSMEKVSFGAAIGEKGELKGIISRKHIDEKGKESLSIECVPEHGKRSSGILPNFLVDSSAYILGIDPKADSEKKIRRARECFETAGQLHHSILDETDSDASKRILDFFDRWIPEQGENSEMIKDHLIDFGKTGFIELTDEKGIPFYEYPEIRKAWMSYKEKSSSDESRIICFDTGREDVPETVHPSIKGIRGAQSSGAALVSFNASAFESYGKDKQQGLNAPISRIGAFKYTTVLNKLISGGKNITYFGSKTNLAVIYWAENAKHAYEDIFAESLEGSDDEMTNAELSQIYMNLSHGGTFKWKGKLYEFSNRFYVLGISPNNARLSIRFFQQNEFGEMLRCMALHEKRLEIIEPYNEKKKLPLWKILQETVRADSKMAVSPQLEEQMLKSILTGTMYPFELYTSVMSRIRTEKKLGYSGWERAAIIKAFFLRNYSSKQWTKEVATVSLNNGTDNESYVLGRLFAVLEQLQKRAAGTELNVTIKDRYFASAATTPGIVFPQLLRLAGNHEKKLDGGMKVYYEKLIGELMGKLNDKSFPMHLSLTEQGTFYLGYYHQTQDMYKKKEDK